MRMLPDTRKRVRSVPHELNRPFTIRRIAAHTYQKINTGLGIMRIYLGNWRGVVNRMNVAMRINQLHRLAPQEAEQERQV